MEDWSFVESQINDLHNALDYAKEHPFKVRLEFDRRFRVWREIIHRNRKLHLAAAPTKDEFDALRGRYESLDKLDAVRLTRRAHKEYLIATGNTNPALIVKHRQVLLYRLGEIRYELHWQLSRYAGIAEYWHQSRSCIYEHRVLLLRGVDNHGEKNRRPYSW